jgi:hypothetical protein
MGGFRCAPLRWRRLFPDKAFEGMAITIVDGWKGCVLFVIFMERKPENRDHDLKIWEMMLFDHLPKLSTFIQISHGTEK